MKTRTLISAVAVLFAAFTLATACHAQTNVVLTLKMSTNGLTNPSGWQTIQTIVTNMPASPQAFYRMEIVLSNAAPPSSGPTNMALIPAGGFSMGDKVGSVEGGDGFAGDELPVHTVNVSAFYMDQTEVTKALWDEVAIWAEGHGYDISAASANGKAADHPAYNVDWFETVKWCNARSEKEGLTPCYTVGGVVMKTGTASPDCNFAASGYRLATEAEWEKAARGGLSGKRFPWGDTITHSQANYYSSDSFSYDVSPTREYHPTYATGWPYSSPVGSFAANEYGLHDMAGNMEEWCWDWYDGNYYATSPSSDPRGPSSGSSRVRRGGGWGSYAGNARAADRDGGIPGDYDSYLGFRCARSSVP